MKATTAKEVLIAAKWILKHSGWCQREASKDKDGCFVSRFSPDCVSRCLTGAVWTVEADEYLREQAFQLLNNQVVIEEGRCKNAITFNDTSGRTKQEVLDLLDRTVAGIT